MEKGTRLKYLLLIWLAFCTLNVRALQPASVTISTSQNAVKVGASVILKVSLANTSDHDIRFSRVIGNQQAELNFTIIIRDNKNHTMADTKYASDAKNKRMPFSEQIYTLKPNEQVSEEAVINNLCDISLPGKYTIQVQKDISIDGKSVTLKSNAITVDVTR